MSVTVCGQDENVERCQDGLVKLKNAEVEQMSKDILYHLGFDTNSDDLEKLFGDVKFVCTGGTDFRMREFAYYIEKELADLLDRGTTVIDYSKRSHRYGMYKVGPVLSVSHGIGVPSLSILLVEIIKLLYHAKAKNPVIFRIGSSGGIDVEPGTVVITNGAVDELMRPFFEIPICGKLVRRPSEFDQNLAIELKALALPEDNFQTKVGKTMCATDFYEGQGRRDGAFCCFTEAERIGYLDKLKNHGVLNIEMECVCFGALTHFAGIKSGIVCVALLNRYNGDQISVPKDVLQEFEKRPQALVLRYIRKCLQEKNQNSS
ncbi:uridine phosphorylase 1-like isoform X2 [Belonocnema kinseyi]|nr:uridine phosphorylase 1-like isoform X2 [Belonocnema kinseyi]